MEFTGEELLGRYLDLHQPFQAFTNARFGRKLDYYQYMDCFADFSAIPKERKYSRWGGRLAAAGLGPGRGRAACRCGVVVAELSGAGHGPCVRVQRAEDSRSHPRPL